MDHRTTTLITDIHHQIDSFAAKINDKFVSLMMKGAKRVLHDIENPTRIHLFALSIREMMSYLLDKYAPDEEVQDCKWFKTVTENGAPSRIQRAEYAIRGGISLDDFPDLKEFECEAKAKLKNQINDLSKLTHVRPETHIEDPEEIDKKAQTIISALLDFFDVIEDYRTEIKSMVKDSIDQHIFETFLYETFDEVDILSTHSLVEFAEVSKISVEKIDSSAVHFRAEGFVNVELNYGSEGDRRRGEGYSTNKYFPFDASFNANINDMKALKDAKYEINTSSWYL